MPADDDGRTALLHDAMAAFAAAWARGDGEALAALLSPTYTHGDIYGGFQDRPAWLAYAAGRSGLSTTIGFREVWTRHAGDLAIVTGINDVAGMAGPADEAVSLRFTQVWRWQDGRWLREAFQATLTTA